MKLHFRAFHGPSDWGWVQQHLKLKRVDDTSGIVAVDEEHNATVAACIFDNWTHTSVTVHWIVTSSMVLRHGWIEEICDYVYNVAERDKMIVIIRSSNEASRKLCEHIGFQEICRIEDMFMHGDDGIIMTMTRDQTKFWTAPDVPAAVNG